MRSIVSTNRPLASAKRAISWRSARSAVTTRIPITVSTSRLPRSAPRSRIARVISTRRRCSRTNASTAKGTSTVPRMKQPPIEPDHQHHAADQEQHIAQCCQQGVCGGALHIADIAVDPAHQVAQPEARVEAGAERLQMAQQIDADVEEHCCRNLHVAIARGDIERIAAQRHADRGRRDPPASAARSWPEQRLIDHQLGEIRAVPDLTAVAMRLSDSTSVKAGAIGHEVGRSAGDKCATARLAGPLTKD